MTSGQEMEWVYSYNTGACTGPCVPESHTLPAGKSEPLLKNTTLNTDVGKPTDHVRTEMHLWATHVPHKVPLSFPTPLEVKEWLKVGQGLAINHHRWTSSSLLRPIFHDYRVLQ